MGGRGVQWTWTLTGSFEYLSDPIFNTPVSLRGTELGKYPPRVLHFIPMADRMERIIAEVDEMMSSAEGRDWAETLLVWEPDIVS
jgi:hypothetical protein